MQVRIEPLSTRPIAGASLAEFTLKTMKTSKITVKFKTKTLVELSIGNRIAVVDSPDHAKARQLAALAEADLLDVDGDDNITVRVIENQPNIGARIVTETRHGNQLFIAESRHGQRRLIRIYEVLNAVNN
jgi:hypothetical protein